MDYKNKAVFLDRDGVINKDTGWPHKPEQIIFLDGIFEFCHCAVQKGYILVVITNQSGVAKGYFSEDDVNDLHGWMKDRFRDQGIDISAFYYCPYHKDGTVEKYKKESEFRKPEPGMILQAAKELSIDLTQSVMIGDKVSDRIKLPELRTIVLKSGYTEEHYDAESLDDVVKMI